MVTDFLVIFEKTLNLSSADSSSTDTSTVSMYLHIINFFVVPELLGSSNQGAATHVESSFLARNSDKSEKTIYFRILTKNATVISASGHLEFTCQAVLHTSTEELLQCHQIKPNCERMAEKNVINKRLISVVIHFGGSVYKWYPIVQAGNVYEISIREDSCEEVLPSLSIIKKNMLLTVTEDMVVRMVEEETESGITCDVGDISKRLFLPTFSTRACAQPASTTR